MTAIRRPGAASAAVLVGLTVSLAAAHAIAPEWSRSAGLDVWNIAEVEKARRSAVERRAEIHAHAEHCARRREIANQLAAQLVANTTTLPAATDEVRALFADDTGFVVMFESLYPTVPTERLRFARHVIERTKRFLTNPAQFEAVTARLEAEYRAMAAEHDSPPAP